MNDFSKQQFTTGQFAAIYGINKRTLMYYDSIDLFKPASVNDNGYRYYTIAQTPLFDAILLLRKLRVPLEEIKEHLTNYSPQRLLEFLHRQDQILDKELAELLWLKRIVQNKIDSMETRQAAAPAQFEILEQKAQAIALSEPIAAMPLEKAIKYLTKFMYDCYHTHSYSGYPCGYMLNASEIQARTLSPDAFSQVTHCFYLMDKETAACAEPLAKAKADAALMLKESDTFFQHEKKAPIMECAFKPAGRYLVGYYKGNWLQMDQAFYRLADYGDEHRLTFTGHAYVENILDDIAVSEDPYYYEARISILLE